jgi:hypothetical protein
LLVRRKGQVLGPLSRPEYTAHHGRQVSAKLGTALLATSTQAEMRQPRTKVADPLVISVSRTSTVLMIALVRRVLADVSLSVLFTEISRNLRGMGGIGIRLASGCLGAALRGRYRGKLVHGWLLRGGGWMFQPFQQLAQRSGHLVWRGTMVLPEEIAERSGLLRTGFHLLNPLRVSGSWRVLQPRARPTADCFVQSLHLEEPRCGFAPTLIPYTTAATSTITATHPRSNWSVRRIGEKNSGLD